MDQISAAVKAKRAYNMVRLNREESVSTFRFYFHTIGGFLDHYDASFSLKEIDLEGRDGKEMIVYSSETYTTVFMLSNGESSVSYRTSLLSIYPIALKLITKLSPIHR